MSVVQVETAMLRISYSLIGSVAKWTLCGQVAGAWVQELRNCWEHTRRTGSASRSVVDLTEVLFIDESGENLLAEMRAAGVEFVATGIDTKHLIENLKSDGERTFRRLV